MLFVWCSTNYVSQWFDLYATCFKGGPDFQHKPLQNSQMWPSASVRFWPKIMLQEQMLQKQLLQEHTPGAKIIWVNILSSKCSRSILWMYTPEAYLLYAPGAYLLHVPGALCILNILLEHILLYAPGALCIQICSWSIFDLEFYSSFSCYAWSII